MTLVRIIDVETSGLDPSLHRVVEVGTVDLILPSPGEDYAAPKRGRMWSSLVNPGIPIPPETSGIHDITDEMVADAPKIGDVLDVLKEGPPDYWCAHNSRFDQRFINPIASIPWLDTYRIALSLWPEAPSHKNNVLRYWLKLKLAAEDQPAGRSHRALWDAYVTAAILRRAILEGMTIEEMVLVSSRPAVLPRFHFGKHAGEPVAKVPDGYLDWILGEKGMDEDVKATAFAELTRRRASA